MSFFKKKEESLYKKEINNHFKLRESLQKRYVIICEPSDYIKEIDALLNSLSLLHSVVIDKYIESIIHDGNNHYITFEPSKLDYLYDHYD